MLHASHLSFVHPFSGELLELNAAMDETWMALFEQFGWTL
jgi:tRNA pseudouridine65 synthase